MAGSVGPPPKLRDRPTPATGCPQRIGEFRRSSRRWTFRGQTVDAAWLLRVELLIAALVAHRVSHQISASRNRVPDVSITGPSMDELTSLRSGPGMP